MAIKRMFSLDKKTNTILDYKTSLSSFVNESIINNSIPVFAIELRASALYLLDLISDNAFINGKFQTSDYSIILRNTVSVTMLWLSEHRISRCKPIIDFLEASDCCLSYDFCNWRVDWDKKETYLTIMQDAIACKSKKKCSNDNLFRMIEALSKIEAEYISEFIIRASNYVEPITPLNDDDLPL